MKRNTLLNAMFAGMFPMYAVEGAGAMISATTDVPNVSVSTDPLANTESATVNFRKIREIKSPEGVITKDWKRGAFKLDIPVPTLAGILAGMQDPKISSFVMDSVRDQIFNVLKNQVGSLIPDDNFTAMSFVLEASMIDVSKLTIEAIANMPKSERGSGITKEMLEAFGADFKVIMLADNAPLTASGKRRSSDTVDQLVAILVGRVNSIRARQDLLTQLDGLLDIWLVNSENGDDFQTVYEYLKTRVTSFLKVDEITEL